MAEKKFKRIERPATEEERARHMVLREKIKEEFPPAEEVGCDEAPPGIPARVRQARRDRGLTCYGLAKLARLPDSTAVRDIELGRDVQLSTLQSVAQALGLRLELGAETV